ncbi:hypothetical protein [Exiguobacterium sp. R-39]|uniref:hypothetical protein n=1 Tax=Exiguobacterium sp. R-39 TaxID=3416708 RepID=UPI003CEB136B
MSKYGRKKSSSSNQLKSQMNSDLKCITIVHGKSEYLISSYIKSAYRVCMKIYSAGKEGSQSIQITSLLHFLDTHEKLRNFIDFKRNFNDVLSFSKKNGVEVIDDFKIFIIMDTDDCEQHQSVSFMNKEMFRGKWYYEYIVPIYNSRNLEEVLEKGRFPHKVDKKRKGVTYTEIFPGSDPVGTKEQKIEEFIRACEKSRSSNYKAYLDYCLENRPNFTKNC